METDAAEKQIEQFEKEFSALCKKHGFVIIGEAVAVQVSADDPIESQTIDLIKATPWAIKQKS